MSNKKENVVSQGPRDEPKDEHVLDSPPLAEQPPSPEAPPAADGQPSPTEPKATPPNEVPPNAV